MKYKVGDVVKLRDDLEVGKEYGAEKLNEAMNDAIGKKAEIKDCYNDRYYAKFASRYGGYWLITDEMIEGLWEECKEKQITMKYKIGDRFRYKDEYNTYKIIRCDEEVGKYITVEEKQVGSRVFDVCEEKNMFLERCNNGKNVTTTIFENMNNNDNFPKQPLKLIDVLNMIAKGELKEGTKVKYKNIEWEYKTFGKEGEKDLVDKANFTLFEQFFMDSLSDEVELIEPPCEHEWLDWETHRMGEGRIRRYRRCNKCGLEEETEDNHFADVGKMEKIEELEECEFYTEGAIVAKLNEVIRMVNAITNLLN